MSLRQKLVILLANPCAKNLPTFTSLATVLAVTAHALSASAAKALTSADVERYADQRHNSYESKFDAANAIARKLSYDTPAPVILSVTTIQLSAWNQMSRGVEVTRLYEAAYALAVAINEPVYIAALQAQAALIHFFAVDEASGLAKSETAIQAQINSVSQLRQHPQPRVLIEQLMAHISLLQLAADDTSVARYLRIAEEVLPTITSDAGRTAFEIAIAHNYADLFFALADADRADEMLTKADKLATQSGNELQRVAILRSKIEIHLYRGDVSAALDVAEEYEMLGRKTNAPKTQENTYEYRSIAFSLLGKHEQALKEARKLLAISNTSVSQFERANALLLTAASEASIGRGTRAQALLKEAMKLSNSDSWPAWAYRVARVQALIASLSGNHSAFVNALDELEKRRIERSRRSSAEQTRAVREYHEIQARDNEVAALRLRNQLDAMTLEREQIRAYWQKAALALMGLLLLAFTAALIGLRQHAKQLKHIADTDALTGAHSRGAALSKANSAFEQAREANRVIAVSVIDVDRFKQFNDVAGHELGDRVLARCAGAIKRNLREDDVFGRLGGDEFLLVLSNASETQAKATLERVTSDLRKEWASETQIMDDHLPLDLTISAGIVAAVPGRSDDVKTFIARADQALLEAKKRGRCRIEVFEAIAA